MRRLKMFFTAFLIGVLCWTPIMQPFAAYAQFVLADSPASGSSDNGADSQQGGDTLPDAGDSEVEGEQGLVPESESGAVEQPDAEDVGAESDHALQSGQEDATTPEVDEAADGVAIDNTANGFVENSWRYDNGVLRTDLEPADRSLLSGDNRPEGATAWGIDVSNHQGAIDWAKVKAAGVDYAILRCGYGEGIMDDSFIRNVQGCKKYGIPFGVYLYCYAWDAQSAREEAEGTLSILSRAGVKPSDLAFPVYYDIENTVGNKNHPDYGKPAGVDGNNQYHVIRNNATFTAMAETYCNIIQNAGYEPGVYASLNWWRNYLNDSKFNSWDRWVAQYYSECTYEGSYSMWQYSSSGRVDGIRGNVDVNWYFGERYPAGWYFKDGSWYYRMTNGLNRTGWLTVRGETYWLDPSADGACASGFTKIDKSTYYFNPSRGQALTRGLFTVSGRTYYAAPADGHLTSGWVFADGEWYNFDALDSFSSRVGWYEEEGVRYHFADTGVMDRGWSHISGVWYRFSTSGAMQRGWARVGESWYYLDSDGAMRTGWLDEGGSRYYLTSSGAMSTGWKKIDGFWYYFKQSGAMQRGWLLQSNTWYLLLVDGRMATGTKLYEGAWSKFDPSGRWLGYCQPGWLKNDSSWYYIEKSGSSAYGWRLVSRTWYYFDPVSRKMQTGWKAIDGGYYYFNSSGAMAASRWLEDSEGKKYYAGSSGAFLSGWKLLNSKWYYFDPDTAYHPVKCGLFSVGEKEYFADSTGAIVESCWIKLPDGVERFASRDGSLSNLFRLNGYAYRMGSNEPLAGFIDVGDGTYLFADPVSKELLTGWQSISGESYYFDTHSGLMRTGWISDNGSWYYCNQSGIRFSGWLKLNDIWYYLDPERRGAMSTGECKVGAHWYYLDEISGAMVTGWKLVKQADHWSFYDPSCGGARRNSSGYVGDRYCSFNSSGRLQSDRSLRSEKVSREAKRLNSYGLAGGWCQAWACRVYTYSGESSDSRVCAWEAAHSWVVSRNRGGIPVGATVYQCSPNGTKGWAGGVYYPDLGHVGIYVGNGMVCSLKKSGVAIDPVEAWTNNGGWLGWGWNGGISLL